MPFIVRAGARLHYRCSGTGPPVALLHALTNDCSAFESTGLRRSLVTSGFCCVTMDAVGHGKSDMPDAPTRYALEEQAQDLLAVMDDLGAGRFALAGYSLGAWMGSGILAQAGTRISSAVLGGWDPLEGARLFTRLADPGARAEEFIQTVKALFAARPGHPRPGQPQLSAFLNCYRQLFEPLPALKDLSGGGAKLYFFCGQKDPYEPNVRAAAEYLVAAYLMTPGDHIAAFTSTAATQFILQALGPAEPPPLSPLQPGIDFGARN